MTCNNVQYSFLFDISKDNLIKGTNQLVTSHMALQFTAIESQYYIETAKKRIVSTTE